MVEQIQLGLTADEAAVLRVLVMEAIHDLIFIDHHDLIAAASFIGPKVQAITMFPSPSFNSSEILILLKFMKRGSVLLGDKLSEENRKLAISAQVKISRLVE
ncbi:hypothetical protein [Pararhizobium sp. O133]|uniref:hypothetical protein n=1 Tax=Pararhizobium sp. O133 TaxID=3449278 RepID=UPI003F6874BE